MRRCNIFYLFIFHLLLQPSASYANPCIKISDSEQYASIVVNAKTGEVVHSKNYMAKRYPASLVKMMTLYIALEHLKSAKIRMQQRVMVSANAAMQPKSKLDLKIGEKITVRDAINGLIVKSANDAAVTLAEAVSGSEEKFVSLMNRRAKQLGMHDTVFCNSHGLHHAKQVSTARDMAILAMALQQHHPEYYHLFSKRSFLFKKKIVKGHNKVLENYKWADGLKTGYIQASGFNIVTSTNKPEGKLIAVVMGGQSAQIRDAHTIELLNNAYAKMHPSRALKKLKKHYFRSNFNVKLNNALSVRNAQGDNSVFAVVANK